MSGCLTLQYWCAGFLSGFGPKGDKTALRKLVGGGGIALFTRTALDIVSSKGHEGLV